jgi:hypothetical protein
VICDRDHIQSIKDHINGIDDSIKFTIEEEANNILPFLDVCIERKENGSLETSVYRKPTNTNQYLDFRSHHPLNQKLGVVRTLMHRCDVVVSTEEKRLAEQKTITDSLKKCGYPSWVFKKKPKPKEKVTSDPSSKHKHMVILPYVEGLGEKLCRVYKKHNISTVFKPESTLRRLLVAPKDKLPTLSQCGCVYQISCKECSDQYIGESGRPLKTRLKEHQKSVKDLTPTSAVAAHAQNEQHHIDWENIKIMDKEQNLVARKIKEAIHIRNFKPMMNRDTGVELPHIYDIVLDRGSRAGHDSAI